MSMLILIVMIMVKHHFKNLFVFIHLNRIIMIGLFYQLMFSFKLKFCFEFEIDNRKNAVKYILDALRFVNDLESLYEILSCTQKLADDIGLLFYLN